MPIMFCFSRCELSGLWQSSTEAKGLLRKAASRKKGRSAAGQTTKNDGLPYGRPRAYSV